MANPNIRSSPSEPPTSEPPTKSHFQALQLPRSARALSCVILSGSPGRRGNRPVLCLAVSDMTPEMEMKPWIFIRRGRCPQRPSPGEGARRKRLGKQRRRWVRGGLDCWRFRSLKPNDGPLLPPTPHNTDTNTHTNVHTSLPSSSTPHPAPLPQHLIAHVMSCSEWDYLCGGT